MRLRFCFASFALLCSALVVNAQNPAPSCADLHIVPAVRECSAVKAISLAKSGVVVSVQPDPEDEFTAADLREFMKTRHGEGFSHFIRLERLGTSQQAKDVLARTHQTVDSS